MKNKKCLLVRLVLSCIVFVTMIRQLFLNNYNNVFLCLLTLLLFAVPSFIDKKLNVQLPGTLEIIILLFIFSAEILGEINKYYVRFPHWDTMLHTLNGFLMAAIGFSLIDILNQHPQLHFKMSPMFVAFVAFCFSMTVGVLWEFFEFGMDMAFHTDMQKDTFINVINSVALDPNNEGNVVSIPINEVVVNGQKWRGYIDIGLIDTMKDLIVNCIGAIVFSIIGVIYIKNRGEKSFAKNFIPLIKKKRK